ncbi:DUF3298 and DUF4163 domain-containing protein [Aquiflexum sp. LQ15W]|uniref:DUF3298 and DUF4163 domain-containing protein n=1 Tax=Cognataquiflexum nitidum TaxID=2922272 RepID=UPI001F12B1F5|nr:DUF3298 and DUF4163 domain-containing protein [Cognataquiflexum nitidum]MCH6198762.1 DUF3298 and DUF4163 domain-containing protein [Cognataquiflexum nitidum]
MKNLRPAILIFTAILLHSCQSETTESGVLDFQQKTFEKVDCAGQDCAKVSLSYPFFTGSSESANFLNAHVEQQSVMFLNIGENQSIITLDSAISTFLRSYVNFKNEFDSQQEWEISIDSKVTFQVESLISIVFDTFSFTGGAHPNSYRLYLNFDLIKNSPLKNEDLVLDKNALLELAESKFRDLHSVADNVTLAEDNRFFLENGEDFFLPTAMGFEGEEFVMYYNPYEIGPYVMGSTELRFTKEEIKGLVRIP